MLPLSFGCFLKVAPTLGHVPVLWAFLMFPNKFCLLKAGEFTWGWVCRLCENQTPLVGYQLGLSKKQHPGHVPVATFTVTLASQTGACSVYADRWDSSPPLRHLGLCWRLKALSHFQGPQPKNNKSESSKRSEIQSCDDQFFLPFFLIPYKHLLRN